MTVQEPIKTKPSRNTVPRNLVEFLCDKRAYGFWVAILGFVVVFVGFFVDYAGVSIGHKVMLLGSLLGVGGIIFNMLAWKN